MRTTLSSYLPDFLSRAGATAFAYRRGLRLVRWSYGRVARTACRFARELEARGLQRGDRILLWAANSPEWVAAFFGCLARGAIVVPLDAGSEPGFVSRVAQQVDAKLALLDAAARERNALACPVMPLEDLESRLSRHSDEPYAAAGSDPDDTFEIVFTSGTTAEPKGVRITHRNVLVNLVPMEEEIGRYLKYERFFHPIRFLNLLPLSHVFGQIMGVFAPQFLGGEVFFQPSLAPSQIVETVKRERISVLVAVPRILDLLREKIERDYESRGALERLRRDIAAARSRHPLKRLWRFRTVHSMFGWKFWAFISGGATLAPETEAFWDGLGFAVIQGYGMTETASLVSVNHPFKLVHGSIGRVMPGQEVKLAADGEILVRGANVTPGYWGGEGEDGAGAGGWLATGDLGEIDRDGNLFFKGRKKDVIVTAAGMKVYPEDIEQALDRQPGVKASAVIAFAGADGPEPLAVLVLRRPEADAKSVIEGANRSLAQHQRVRRWFIWPEGDFPRTATQKVRKRIVAERIAADSTRIPREAAATGDAARAGALGDMITKIRGEAPGPLGGSETLGADLGLDSLGRVALVGAIEDRYQIELDEAAFTEATTLGDVEKIIREGTPEGTVPYPYPRWQLRPLLRWASVALLYLLVLPFTRLLGRPAIRGRERLRGLRGPCVFACNHVTIVDHALVLLALPARLRGKTAIAMDGEILRGFLHPPAGTGIVRRVLGRLRYGSVVFFFNVFSMPRKSGFRRSFLHAGELMDRGYSVLVFPEGRHTEDGKMQPFMPGTGLLVAQLEAPVVPVRIDGLWELKAKKRRFAKPGELSIAIGAPVRYAPGADPEQIAQDLKDRVAEL